MKKEFRFNRQPLSLKVNKTITALVITLGVMIVVLATFFLTMVSSSGQKGYELKQLQIQNEELHTQNAELQRELTEDLSFQKIEKSEKFQKMQKPEGKIYVK